MTEPWSSSLELTVPSVSGNGAGQKEKALPFSGQAALPAEMSTLPEASVFKEAESRITSYVSPRETALQGRKLLTGVRGLVYSKCWILQLSAWSALPPDQRDAEAAGRAVLLWGKMHPAVLCCRRGKASVNSCSLAVISSASRESWNNWADSKVR